MSEQRCHKCGGIVSAKDKFCGGCGAKVELQSTETRVHEEQEKPEKQEIKQTESKPEDSNKNKAQKKSKVLGIIAVAVIVLLLAIGVKTVLGGSLGGSEKSVLMYKTDQGYVIRNNGKDYLFKDGDAKALFGALKEDMEFMNDPSLEGLRVTKMQRYDEDSKDFTKKYILAKNYVSKNYLIVMDNDWNLYIADFQSKKIKEIDDVIDFQLSKDEKSILIQEDGTLNLYSTKDFEDEIFAEDIDVFTATENLEKVFIQKDGDLCVFDSAGEEIDKLDGDIRNGVMAIDNEYLVYNARSNAYVYDVKTLDRIKKLKNVQFDQDEFTRNSGKLFMKTIDGNYYIAEKGEVEKLRDDDGDVSFVKNVFVYYGYTFDEIKKNSKYRGYLAKFDDEIIFSPDGKISKSFDLDYEDKAFLVYMEPGVQIFNRYDEELRLISYNTDFEETTKELDSIDFLFGNKFDSMLGYRFDNNRVYHFDGEDITKLTSDITVDEIKYGQLFGNGNSCRICTDKVFLIRQDGETEELYDDDEIEKAFSSCVNEWLAFETDKHDLYIIKDYKKAELVAEDVEKVDGNYRRLYYIDEDECLYTFDGKSTKKIANDVSKLAVIK